MGDELLPANEDIQRVIEIVDGFDGLIHKLDSMKNILDGKVQKSAIADAGDIDRDLMELRADRAKWAAVLKTMLAAVKGKE